MTVIPMLVLLEFIVVCVHCIKEAVVFDHDFLNTDMVQRNFSAIDIRNITLT